MASQRDKERMARIGAFMDELNREAVVEAANRSPGENIAIGLQLVTSPALRRRTCPRRR